MAENSPSLNLEDLKSDGSKIPFSLNDLKGQLDKEGFFESEGQDEDFTDEDYDEMKASGVPERPHFPLIIFSFGVFLDIVKLATLGFAGIIVFIIGWMAVRIYLMGKISFMKRYVWRKAVFHATKNMIPIVGAVFGSWGYFIFRAHSKNWEKIDQILTAVEKLITKGDAHL